MIIEHNIKMIVCQNRKPLYKLLKNRLKAISELGKGSYSVYNLSAQDAMKRYPDKMKDILEGAFTHTINE